VFVFRNYSLVEPPTERSRGFAMDATLRLCLPCF
jgi:hypothetical protein